MLNLSQIKQNIFTSLKQQAVQISPCAASGNNRIFSFRTEKDDYIIKYYSLGQRDDRNRIGHEWRFLKHLHSKNITCIPRPVVKNKSRNFSILSKIDALSPTQETDRNHLVNLSALFINMINSDNGSDPAGNVLDAFEHNLDLNKTILNIQMRFQRLRQVCNTEDIKFAEIITEAEDLLAHKAAEIEATRRSGSTLTRVLGQSELCLSPSDFGFHNILLDHSGRPYFIDFEYAGWDDPAKLICDFVLHPANHLTILEAQLFLQSLTLPMINIERCRVIFGLFALKWVAIILNIFLPEQLERKQFANPKLNFEHEKHFRLETSQEMLKKTTICPFDA